MAALRDLRARCRLLATLVLVAAACLMSAPAQAATGCALNDPEGDLRRFFPELTAFRTHYVTFERQGTGGHEELGRRLGDRLDPVYETQDVPYTLYVVDEGGERAGYVFGANQRGTFSNIQVIAVTGARLELKDIYLQKIRSPAWEAFKSEAFRKELLSVPFERYPTLAGCYAQGECRDAPLRDPSEGKASEDFRHIVRALAKLRLLAEILLTPGSWERSYSEEALAEWVALAWDGEPAPEVEREPRFLSTAEVDARGLLRPGDPVLVHVGEPGRIWPLEALELSPVVLDRLGELPVAVTWSTSSASALVLASPGAGVDTAELPVRPSGDVLFGARLVSWGEEAAAISPILGRAMRRGAKVPRVERLPGVFVMPWSVARWVQPSAPVLVAAAKPEAVDALWQRRAKRSPALGSDDHLLVMIDAEGHSAAAPADLGRNLHLVEGPELRAILVRARGASAAFDAAGHRLMEAVDEPLSGLPWLWDAGTETLYEGLSGRPLAGPGAPLVPLVLFEIPSSTWGAIAPKG